METRIHRNAPIPVFPIVNKDKQGNTMPRHHSEGKLDMNILRETAEKCKNWGRWGPEDEAGTLNFISPEDIINAAKLIRKGKVFSLGLNFDNEGPQKGLWGNRFNPIHTMLATGTDAVAGNQDEGGIRYADDMVSLPLQCGTQWDALGHIFYDDKMWNGYDARLVDTNGAQKNGIEKVKDKMVGRGVLLDVAKHAGVEALDEGMAITNQDLNEAAEAQGVEVRRGDFVIVRTGMMGQRLRAKEWGGYAGGDAPGLAFETAEWIYEKEIAAICCDNLGLRGATQRDDRGTATLALGRDPDDRHHHGRNLRGRRAGRRLHGRRRLRVLLLRTAAADHGRCGIAAEPDRHQVRRRHG